MGDDQMLVKVRQFLTKSEDNPVPLRTMRIDELKKETAKAVLVRLVGTPIPQSECIHCGREIKHPQSLYFGIGSTCIKHFPQLLANVNYNDVEESYKQLKASMTQISWEGWLPKAHIEMKPELFYVVTFTYKGKNYKTRTQDLDKVQKIQKHDRLAEITEVMV